MANHKSALKRHRQSVKRHARNRSIKSEIHTVIKRVISASKEEAGDLFTLAQSKLDRARRKGVLTRNSVARRVSKLQKLVLSK